jgi:phage major head subunit gpT-like protein
MILNKSNIGEFFIGLSAAWVGAYKALLVREQDWKKVAMVMPSNTAENLYGWLSRWPKVRKWIGERHLKNLALNGYRLKNESWEDSIGVNLDELSDDAAGMYQTTVKVGWSDAVANFFDAYVFALLKNGNSATIGLCFDGTPFFGTNHPTTSADGTTILQSNSIAGAGAAWYLLDVRGDMKPLLVQERKAFEFASVTEKSDGTVFKTNEAMFGIDGRFAFGYGFWQRALRSAATLDTAGFDAAMVAFAAIVDEEGEPLGTKPSLLVCGPSNRAAALKVVMSQKLADNTDNHNYKAVDVLVVQWLP